MRTLQECVLEVLRSGTLHSDDLPVDLQDEASILPMMLELCESSAAALCFTLGKLGEVVDRVYKCIHNKYMHMIDKQWKQFVREQ